MAPILFPLGALLAAVGILSPALALLAGLALGLCGLNAYPAATRWTIPRLLKLAVVLLGFGMNLRQVLVAGRSGLLYSAVGICAALLLGTALGRWLRVAPKAAFLVSAGTAICGGSAIAAVAPIAGASEDEMAVALGVIFTLNAVALLLFPTLGHAWRLSQTQFGLWAALAIHDTSSVVGATARYGPTALAVGTAVKLARALWIVPLSLGTAAVLKSRARIRWPWFILYFALAALIDSVWPQGHRVWAVAAHAGRLGLDLTLFLIGASLDRATLRRVGPRPLLQGVALWAVVASATLTLVIWRVIHL